MSSDGLVFGKKYVSIINVIRLLTLFIIAGLRQNHLGRLNNVVLFSATKTVHDVLVISVSLRSFRSCELLQCDGTIISRTSEFVLQLVCKHCAERKVVDLRAPRTVYTAILSTILLC